MHVKCKASAPAKVILFGEHFVVYSRPAIVVAIDRRASITAEIRSDDAIYVRSKDLKASGYFYDGRFRVEEGGPEAEAKVKPIECIVRKLAELHGKKIGVTVEIDSLIPVEAGLGSSAAVAVASAACIGQLLGLKLSKDHIYRLAYEAERLVHGTPSGVDPTISTYGGVLRYVRERGASRLNVGVDLQLVIGCTRMARSTGKLVAQVRDLAERYPSIFNPLSMACESIVEKAVEALEIGDLETAGRLMDMNQGLLSTLGVSNEVLEKLIYAARRAGAYGAKLTGAGGGGCMIALAPTQKVQDITRAIRDAGGYAFVASKTEEGVRIGQ